MHELKSKDVLFLVYAYYETIVQVYKLATCSSFNIQNIFSYHRDFLTSMKLEIFMCGSTFIKINFNIILKS